MLCIFAVCSCIDYIRIYISEKGVFKIRYVFRWIFATLNFPLSTDSKLKPGDVVVRVSPDFYRPTDVVNLWGDPTKAKAVLGWNPNKTSFEQLVKLMVEHDIAKVAAEGASMKVRTNLEEYLEKGIVK